MKRTPFFLALLVLPSIVLCCLPAHGEPPRQLYLWPEPPPQEPLNTLPVYVKKTTWDETLRASLHATFEPGADKGRAAEGREFKAKVVRLTADSQPVQLQLEVAGLDRVYFATLGRLPESGSAHFLNLRLFDKQGRCVELTAENALAEGRVNVEAVSSTELEIGGTAYRGFELAPGEVAFELAGKYARLELLVYYQRQQGLPPYAAVDCAPVFVNALDCRRTQEAFWDLVARDFRDRQSQVEMEMERRDGIWNPYVPAREGAGNAYYLARAGERLELAQDTGIGRTVRAAAGDGCRAGGSRATARTSQRQSVAINRAEAVRSGGGPPTPHPLLASGD